MRTARSLPASATATVAGSRYAPRLMVMALAPAMTCSAVTRWPPVTKNPVPVEVIGEPAWVAVTATTAWAAAGGVTTR